MKFLARCVRGLEWVAADEIAAGLGAGRIRMRRREVRFSLDEPSPAILGLRTVDDVFAEVGRIDGVGHTKDVPPQLARQIAGLDWTEAVDAVRLFRELSGTPRFDVVVSLEGRRNFNRFTLEDAVGEALAARLGAVFLSRTQDSSRTAGSELTVRVLLQGNGAAVALRLGARPLHRREYKQDVGPGSLHPPLAAALVRLAVTEADRTVGDPFCGDGTIPIETALAHPAAQVIASDLGLERLANARANAERAGAGPAFVRADAGELPWRGVDVLVTNPPWSVAVAAGGALDGTLKGFWSELPSLARRVCLIADAELDAPAQLRAAGLSLLPHVQRVRVAGRISDLVLAAPDAAPELSPGLAGWLDRAVGAGLVGANDSF